MRMSSSTQSVTSLVSLNERPSSPSLVSAPDTEEDLEVGVVRVVPATCPKLEAAERAYAEAQREYEQRLAAADRSNRQLIVAKAATIRCNGERMQANRSQASAHVKQPLVAEKTELDERLDYICAERDDLKAKLEDANRELASLRKGLEEIVDPGDREAQVAQRRNPKWGHDDPIFISVSLRDSNGFFPSFPIVHDFLSTNLDSRQRLSHLDADAPTGVVILRGSAARDTWNRLFAQRTRRTESS